MAEEQGLSFTIIEAPHPMADCETVSTYNPRERFYAARRVWLGWTAGTDWLHDAIEAEFGEDAAWYDVESRRNATHIGASGEVAAVVLILMGLGAADMLRTYYRAFAQRLGEASADGLLGWARERATERRRDKEIEWTDGPPDFFAQSVGSLSARMAGALADILEIPEERLEVVSAERREGLAMYAVYRDSETRHEYTAEVGRDSVTFKRLNAPGLPPGG